VVNYEATTTDSLLAIKKSNLVNLNTLSENQDNSQDTKPREELRLKEIGKLMGR